MNGNNKSQSPGEELSSRRSLLRKGSTVIGACMLPSLINSAKAQQRDINDTGPLFNVKDFGATGKREDSATAAFKSAIESCTSRGGGIVNVPPGDYTVGTIQLKNNVTLHIEAGATLFLSQSREEFVKGAYAMIFAENCSNIAVTGSGTLDGLAQYDFTEMDGVDPEISKEIDIARAAGEDMRRYYRKKTAMNTFMFILNNCTNVKLSDITVLHSPLWNVRLNDCDRVHISRIYIYSDLEKGVNADGIDLCSCNNVTISDSLIVTGDDGIIIKTISRNGNPAQPSQNITVTNCILESSSQPLGIGTETEADISHVVFNNCVIRNSNKGFGINVQDGATVSNIIFSNLTIELNRRHWNWWGSAETCRFVLKKRKPESRLGKIRDVTISNIISHPRGTSTMIGHPDQPLENFTISNMSIEMNPEDAKDKRATSALVIENADKIKIRDLSVAWTEDVTEKKWESALVLKDTSNIIIDSFSGRQGLKESDAPVLLLHNVQNTVIRNSDAAEEAGTFIHIGGEKTRNIVIRNNEWSKARKDITFANPGLKKEVILNNNI